MPRRAPGGRLKPAPNWADSGVMARDLLQTIEQRTRLRFDGVFANVQTPLIGRPGPARMSPAHMRFLAALGGGEPRDAAASTLLRSLPERMAEKRIGSLTQVATRAIEALRGAAFVPTVVHGDFAPFNLRMEGGVLRAFDWENAWLDGLPLLAPFPGSYAMAIPSSCFPSHNMLEQS